MMPSMRPKSRIGREQKVLDLVGMGRCVSANQFVGHGVGDLVESPRRAHRPFQSKPPAVHDSGGRIKPLDAALRVDDCSPRT